MFIACHTPWSSVSLALQHTRRSGFRMSSSIIGSAERPDALPKPLFQMEAGLSIGREKSKYGSYVG